ncbi:RtcB family protein [Thiovibrio frasassiensis]|uniref:3'-phosphate/5'-hydroxy nucleic acid ligase n=1 Tax=Thiovibrio frasassiensis TaxID=2984131 RepID=A0A9X4RR72_9BACT|nr:RtcB family protein [Thiovibrio frasassiensis]MDG4477052.1 RtcB family protein [Thiovibrio frasassiensis]
MKQIITSEKTKIKLWLDDIDAGAFAQAKNLANLPFVFKHVAVMPDAHQGYGMPIGGVMASEEVVIPNAVGVDIGCGMCAVRTSLATLSTEQLKGVLTEIRRTIPLGFKHHKRGQDRSLMPKSAIPLDELTVIAREYQSALTQLGTLGGGNHFIEIQKGNDGHVWLMVHSGSRNLGFKVANYYNRLAMELNRQWGSKIPPNWQLAFLPISSAAGQIYLHEMRFCVEFAYANRKMMMERVKEAVLSVVQPVFFEPMINIAHNYAAMEVHFGKNVMVHRKGATRAQVGEIGIVPGSQGTPSYIVRGKGNKESFESCAHGAGRKMGRKQAQRQLDLEREKKRLDDQGIIHAIRSVSDLEEAAGAYKDIDAVIENQLDLVEVLVELRPLAVIKG